MKWTKIITFVILIQNLILAQQIELTNNGDTLTLQDGAVLYVEGGVWNKTAGEIYNDGTIYIQDTIKHDANNKMFIDNLPSGQAIIGTVILNGAVQRIMGNFPVYFDSLLLRGTDKKILEQHAYVEHFLDLENKEFATQTFNLTVTNPATASVARQAGFVSSDLGGYFIRYTNSNNAYLFPVGASTPTLRYRPVEITPDNTNNRYGVRFANLDATTEGKDRSLKPDSICEINPLFYHQIQHIQGTASANVAITYDPNDPVKDGVAQWDGSQWIDRTTSATNNTTTNQWILQNWNNFNTENFAFDKVKITASLNMNDTIYCENTNQIILTGENPTGGTFYLNGQQLNSNVISPSQTGSGTFTIEYVYGPQGCQDTAKKQLIIKATPNPQLNVANDTSICAGAPLQLQIINTNSNWTYQWNTGNNSPQIVINQQGTYYVVVADTSLQEICYSDTLFRTISIIDSLHPILSGDSLICENDSALLRVIPDTSIATYTWYLNGQQIAQGNPTLSANQSGTYYVVVSTQCFNEPTNSLNLNVLTLPVADFTFSPAEPSVTDVVDFNFTGQQGSDPITSYEWNLDNNTLYGQNVSYQFPQDGYYEVILTVTSENGCQDTAIKYVPVRTLYSLFIPNSFTPNGDNLNDEFFPTYTGLKNVQITIYDRWGNLIWTGSDTNKWNGTYNGKPVPEGVYVYVIKATVLGNNKTIERTGSITLIR